MKMTKRMRQSIQCPFVPLASSPFVGEPDTYSPTLRSLNMSYSSKRSGILLQVSIERVSQSYYVLFISLLGETDQIIHAIYMPS